MKSFHFLFMALTLAFMIAGCSGSAPTAPQENPAENSITFNSGLIGVSDYFPDGTPASGMGTLGMFNLNIDPVSQTAELVSVRQSALTDVLEIVDITNFLAMAPCSDCVKIQSVGLDADGNVVVRIGVKHPFMVGDPLKPITGQNRADLHVFNVEGIVISNAVSVQFPNLNVSTAGFELINADGYTSYLDSALDPVFQTDASIHPYITHFDDYSIGNFDAGNPTGFASVTDPGPSGNLVMPMGVGANDYDFQDYAFRLSGEPMDFIFAVGCTYAVSSASKAQRFTPEYRVPQHNKKAASEVSFHIVSNDLAGEDTSSTAEIEVHVVDINHGVTVGVNLNEMFADSSVDDIFIDIPGVMSSLLVLDGNNPVSGTGHDPSDPLVYSGTITNTSGASEGTYYGVVKVSDSYSPGLNTAPLLAGMDGIERVSPTQNPLEGLFDIAEFATYQLFSISIEMTDIEIHEINPDHAYQHEYVDDIVITGRRFINITSVRLEMGTEIIEAESFNVVSDTLIESEFDFAGSNHGLYNVVVEGTGNNSGVLENGFEILIKCGETAPELDDVYTFERNINVSWVSEVMNAGPYEGYTLIGEVNIISGSYRVYDHMTQSNNTPITSWTAFQAAGNPLIIKAANHNGLMMVYASYSFSTLQVMNQTTGARIQNIFFRQSSDQICGIVGDFDNDDNFWLIVNSRPDPGLPNIYEYQLQYWAYNPSTPSIPYSFVAQYDITDLFRNYISDVYKWTNFGDLVVDPGNDYLYVFYEYQSSSERYLKLSKVDITGSSPSIIMSYNFAGENLRSEAQIDMAQLRGAKLALDLSDTDYAKCRLLAMGSKEEGGQCYLNIYRFDTDLNLFDKSSTPYNITSGSYTRYFNGMALDVKNRVVSHVTNHTWGDPFSYYGISPLPADW